MAILDVSLQPRLLGEVPAAHLRTDFLVDEVLAMETTIPAALRICADCAWDLAEPGSELCVTCLDRHRMREEYERSRETVARAEAYEHAARANAVFAAQPRETGGMPEPEPPPHFSGFALVFLLSVAFWIALAIVCGRHG